MTPTKTSGHLLAALEGCYEAPRAAALSGVPVSTVYCWARQGIVVPTVSPEKPKRWSYADLMALRLVYWLRHPKRDHPLPVSASPMNEVKRALAELDDLGFDIWSRDIPHASSPLRVDSTGRIYIVSVDRVETTHREGVLGETLDLLGPFNVGEGHGPDLIRPRPHLRIIPGKVSGEPHLVDSRITTQAVAALFERFRDIGRVVALYPDLDEVAVVEAIEFERELAA